jgi:NADH:ubiquinone oxidoreductase subunit 5 (subunit L)/multisubunit Na+/H+ antiporter MnhA subunit
VILTFDAVSSLFTSVLVIALILCFAFLSEYFEYDVYGPTIIFLSSLFSQLAIIFFMSADIFSMLVLWELISVVSFFLIRFWSARVTTLKAGLKVFVISQLGDVFFILGCCLAISLSGSSDVVAVNASIPSLLWHILAFGHLRASIPQLFSVAFLAALFLKSAQFVFYPWLLDAMEAPVPISAQLHSSTLVIIGFYVVLRLWPSITTWHGARELLVFAGSVTSLGASILGLRQFDGKRLLACSTAGQLGYVNIALGLGMQGEAMLLLAFCCCNKAYTFVWFGSLMERLSGLSDFRLLRRANVLFAERAGLFSALLNSTVFPGAFA